MVTLKNKTEHMYSPSDLPFRSSSQNDFKFKLTEDISIYGHLYDMVYQTDFVLLVGVPYLMPVYRAHCKREKFKAPLVPIVYVDLTYISGLTNIKR